MDATSVTLVLATIIGWSIVSARAQASLLSTPMVFVTVGLLFTEVFDVLHLEVEHEAVRTLAEVTLVWVLFADASAVKLRAFRSDAGTYVRLLGVGLPLTIGLGTLVALGLLGMDPWVALLVGAALAPTDAALGASVMTNPDVPERTRRTLNVESGLNDGIATPVVLLAVAGVATDLGLENVEGPGHVLVSLAVGVLVGVALGVAGGVLTRRARARGWLSEQLAGPAVLALALMAYTGAGVVDGNGFVAAFIGGLAFGACAGRGRESEIAYVEATGALASMVAWLTFGALAVPSLGGWLEWRVVAYALLSLTLLRMVPVALALAGSGRSRLEVAFIGWFGPRGLASVIFALLALEGLGSAADEAVATISLTVLLSVVAHGLSAVPLARRFGRRPDPSASTATRPLTRPDPGSSPARVRSRIPSAQPAQTSPARARTNRRPTRVTTT